MPARPAHPPPDRPAIDERPLDRLLAVLPAFARRGYASLRRPEARWLRPPVAVLLVLGGLVGVVPILGLGLIPIGLLLLGEDIPALKRTTMRALGAVQGWWDSRRGRSPP